MGVTTQAGRYHLSRKLVVRIAELYPGSAHVAEFDLLATSDRAIWEFAKTRNYAAGINCVVGTAAASVIPAIRADFPGSPVLTLIYGSSEGPAQRIRLETFVHQVHRWSRRPGKAVSF